MSSVLKPSTAGSVELPFASYAQIIRMLVPPAERISFHDPLGNALWINDGVEEPEFRLHVELVLARARQPNAPAPGPSGDGSFVYPIRNAGNAVVGALGISCREASGPRYRGADAVERMLTPVLTILGHAWPTSARIVALPTQASHDTATRQAAVAASQIHAGMPVPAMLRKTLSLATGLIDCAFGAVILPERPFTLTQSASTDESDLSITAAVDNIREHVIRYMKVRSEPLVVNNVSRKAELPYKLLVAPVRDDAQQIVALLLLFRSRHARDFASVDVDELSQLAARVPTHALSEMAAPQAPVVATVVKLPQAQPAQHSERPQTAPAAQSAPVRQTTPNRQPAPAPRVQSPSVAKPDTPRSPNRQAAPAQPPVQSRTNVSVSTPATRQTVPVAAAVVAPSAALPSASPSAPMDERIRTALRLGSFDLYAQKISPMRAASQTPRFEVLLRMRDAGKLHGPPSFFAAAESSRLLPELDCWVIGELLQTLRKRAVTVRTSGLEFSINLAGQSLATAQFAEFIVAEVCRTAIPAGLLVFEISERTALEHEDAMEDLSARLRDVGCRIALDNCRSGLGTLDPLNKWPVSRVKIDGSLIRHLGVSARSESQIRAVAQLAADRGIETVAECVESQRIHDKLLEMGIDFAQGFHLAKPQPLQTLFR